MDAMAELRHAMTEITRLLDDISKGQSQAAERLLEAVYDELRRLASDKLARESPGQTLQGGGQATPVVDLAVESDSLAVEPAREAVRSAPEVGAYGMTLALALGYDWLFDDLTPKTRLAVREAILRNNALRLLGIS